uniref:Uncharacterized protein n=1 Tax=Oryza glumipatula TaxID=40148 RepID=A0A0D9Z4T7_9ORYZ
MVWLFALCTHGPMFESHRSLKRASIHQGKLKTKFAWQGNRTQDAMHAKAHHQPPGADPETKS